MTEQQLSQFDGPEGPAEAAAEVWRNELTLRLERYKKRRGRRIEGAFTMRFPFPADDTIEPVAASEGHAVNHATSVTAVEEVVPPEADVASFAPDTSTPAVALAAEPVAGVLRSEDRLAAGELVLESAPAPEPGPEPFVDTIIRPRPKRKVIAFPKHLSVAPETSYRLADPVTSDIPRILDVPEELEAIPSTPFLEGLQFELPNTAAPTTDREHVDLPFRAVTISRRVAAGLIDLALTGVGLAIFAAVTFKALAGPPLSKPLVLGVLAAAVVLWSTYQYLFAVYSGKTLGMMAMRTRLRTFTGEAPTWRQRRYRVLGFYLSALSLGMGLMWAFVDVDGLCWHDRLSRTYLSDRELPPPTSSV
jgi:uncharacterized RDD family membrane protein YckC